MHLFLGFAEFIVNYSRNLIKALDTTRIYRTILAIDEELLRLAHPNRDIIQHQRTQRILALFSGGMVAYFVFMAVFDYLVFRE